MLRRILLILLALLIIIQLFRPQKNIHAGPQPASIAAYGISPAAQAILQKACYDCHSNNTRYPWYNKIQPVAWWLQQHVNSGKRELNFDEFMNYTTKKQAHKLEEIEKLINNGGMPLHSYLWIHKDARLTKEEKDNLLAWVQSVKSKVPVQ